MGVLRVSVVLAGSDTVLEVIIAAILAASIEVITRRVVMPAVLVLAWARTHLRAR